MELGFPGPSLESTPNETSANRIALQILSGLRTSRLFHLLRVQNGLVYRVNYIREIYPGFGLAGIYSEVSNENLTQAMETIIREVGKIYKLGPSEEEIQFLIYYLTNQAMMEFDHPVNITNWLESDLLWRGKIELPEAYVRRISKIKVKNVRETIEKYWDFSKANLIIQGPIENSKANQKKFLQFLEPLR